MRHILRFRTLASTSVMGTLTAVALCAASASLGAQLPLRVDVWFDGGNSFDRGMDAPLRYSADRDAHVAVVRVDADGRFSVLSPAEPNERSDWQRGPGANTVPFRADEADGVGYVFAIASRTPLDFRKYRTSSGRWMVGSLARHPEADPFALVDRFARTVSRGAGSYSIAYVPYEIGRNGYRNRGARGAVYSADDANGGYGTYDGYGDYDYTYGDPWAESASRWHYQDYRFPAYSGDPRSRYLRHCPDGTLAPYATPCPPAFRPGMGLQGGRFDGIAGARTGGQELDERRGRTDGRTGRGGDGRGRGGDGRSNGRGANGSSRPRGSMPHPTPVHGRP